MIKGKLNGKDIFSVRMQKVLGGKTAREIAETKKILKFTKNVPPKLSDAVTNQKLPIGPKRAHLLK